MSTTDLLNLSHNLSNSIDKIKEWKNDLNESGDIGSEELLMLIEMLDRGTFYLALLLDILMTHTRIKDEGKRILHYNASKEILDKIKGFVAITKKANINM